MKRVLQIKAFRNSIIAIGIFGMILLGFSKADKNSSLYRHGPDNPGPNQTGLGVGITPREDLKPMPVYNHWQNYTTKEGLPGNKVN
ncbi:MAG TPA: hypothetical protein VI583_14185, partial [Cyclobacteriaceae bacterium]|nr:hypothetical protein [Cyclobacteriaceae bacterium]